MRRGRGRSFVTALDAHACLCFVDRVPPPRSTLFPYTTLFRSLGGSTSLNVARTTEVPLLVTAGAPMAIQGGRSEEHTSELQSHSDLVCRLLLEKKKGVRTDSRRIVAAQPSGAPGVGAVVLAVP